MCGGHGLAAPRDLEIVGEDPEKPSTPRWPLISIAGRSCSRDAQTLIGGRFNKQALSHILRLETDKRDSRPPGLRRRNGRAQR